MKPIEAGCRAVVINDKKPPSANGVIVTISHRDPSPEFNNFWVVKESMAAYRYGDNSIPEHKLQRIDDDDVALGSWEELADIWNPRELVV